ncbi:MAG: hypothetical protein L6Q33_00775 [Bacteriovoracaceae bacterium]|nr:hypothetical protein [Bacteriovoracaceae bacterium]
MKLFILMCSLSFLFKAFGVEPVPQAVAVPVEKPSCSMEGELAGGSMIGAMRCCHGLTLANWWTHQNLNLGCQMPPPPGTGGTCIKCGDGKCDQKNNENKCNCPKDCKS